MTSRNSEKIFAGKRDRPPRVIVGLSGASGVSIGIRLLEALAELKVESHLVMTGPAAMTIGYESALKPKEVAAKADYSYAIEDIAAPIASGSFKTDGMIIAPCSIKSMSEIATGVTTSLLTRAADVMLKERRPLILMVRETPLHLGHLRNLTALTEMGAIIMPPVPAFYAAPHTLAEMVDQLVGRALDVLGYDWPDIKRWGENIAKSKRKPTSPARGVGHAGGGDAVAGRGGKSAIALSTPTGQRRQRGQKKS